MGIGMHELALCTQQLAPCALLSAFPTGCHCPHYICISIPSTFLPPFLPFLKPHFFPICYLPSSLTDHLYPSSPVPLEPPTTWDLFPQVLESPLGILAHRAPLACQEHPMRSY